MQLYVQASFRRDRLRALPCLEPERLEDLYYSKWVSSQYLNYILHQKRLVNSSHRRNVGTSFRFAESFLSSFSLLLSDRGSITHLLKPEDVP
jgi:hypothetical protein